MKPEAAEVHENGQLIQLCKMAARWLGARWLSAGEGILPPMEAAAAQGALGPQCRVPSGGRILPAAGASAGWDVSEPPQRPLLSMAARPAVVEYVAPPTPELDPPANAVGSIAGDVTAPERGEGASASLRLREAQERHLIAQGLAALRTGDETLAYRLFRKATEQSGTDAKAWFWRARTAENTREAVSCLQRALLLDPRDPEIQSHLAWAQSRLDREEDTPSLPVVPWASPTDTRLGPKSGSAGWLRVIVEFPRVAAALVAFVAAALWTAAGLQPALSSLPASLPKVGQTWLPILPSLNSASLPGGGRLPLPGLDYGLGLFLPFVIALLLLFVGGGLADADRWAPAGAFVVAGMTAYLSLWGMSNSEAAQANLALSIGLVIGAAAAQLGAFGLDLAWFKVGVDSRYVQ